MFTRKLINRLAVIVSTTVFSMSTIQSAHAGPGPLATAPLFLSTIVEPNVFFTIDDSGSMDWGPMVANGTAGLATTGGLPIIDGEDRAYYAHSFSRLYDGSRYVLPPADGTRADWDLGWVARTHHGNLNYYNPTVTYSPWPGSKADGSPMYSDADPTNALKDPFDPSGESVDLTRSYNITAGDADDMFDRNIAVNNFWIAVYFEWNDTDNDGVIEQSDGRTRIVIPTDRPAEMQNFANWFQYHRTRINATKAIIGTTINNTDASRMGMRLFNDDQLKDVETMSDKDKKRELLEAFYDYDIPAQGTPMRRSLEETGDYFQETGGSAPILSAAKGGECQQNFNILMGDGFWNGGDPGVGNRDINGGDGNTPFDGNASESNDGGNYADNWEETLADVAMDNYERDLRGDLANKVPTTPNIDEADHQHLVTYTIAFGITGTLDPANPAHDPLSASFPGWPDPDNGNPERVDDMWHAAYNGRGKYFSAQQPDELEIALGAAIADIAERTATSSAVAFSSAKLTTDTTVYLAEFNSNRWQGDLFAYKIDPATGDLAASAEWSAGSELLSRSYSGDPRTILTYDGTAGIKFQWGQLTPAQKQDLRKNPAGGDDVDAVADARLRYLRGER
ncbi:MAG: hypothetical protein KJN95_12400, partial [Gammaproteobacteria bacterium]|nr:hypothetical protein [Gammaproteobacteria bacterium]